MNEFIHPSEFALECDKISRGVELELKVHGGSLRYPGMRGRDGDNSRRVMNSTGADREARGRHKFLEGQENASVLKAFFTREIWESNKS